MKINIKIKKLKAIIGFVLLYSLFFTNISAQFYISVDNGYAGKSTILNTGNIGKNKDLKISIEKPNGEKIFINEKSGNDGKLNFKILGYHTKKSGKYNLGIELENGIYSKSNFFINSGKFSLGKSKIFSSEKSIAAKIDKTDIVAKIVDKYGNPIEGHKIKIFSSRNDDVFINGDECKTDNIGKCIFKIKSQKEGKSIFTAINLSENKILKQRVPIIFYTEEEKFAIGGNPFSANLLDASVETDGLFDGKEFGVISEFKIETSDNIVLNSDDNFMTISAIDEDGNVVKDYIGDIKISIPNDENAVIPGNGLYSFTKKDQGIHEFSLSTVFTKSGDNSVVVYSVEDGEINPSLKGVKNIKVMEKKESSSSLINKDLLISFPSNGTKLGNNQVQLSGKGTPFTDLKIYINEKKEGDTVPVNGDGVFSAKINGLNEGENKIHVTENQGLKRSSEDILVFIDTSAPVLTDIEIFPKKIEPETNFNLKIFSEKGLSTIKVLINGNIEILNEVIGSQGTYEANILGPSEVGKYPVDVILVDSLGNKETYRNQGELIIKEKNTSPSDKIDTINLNVDLNKIHLKWDAPNSQTKIVGYKVFLGTSENKIELFGNSKVADINIENLKWNKSYVLGVKSENEFGKLSEMSDLKTINIGENPNKKIIPKKKIEKKVTEHKATVIKSPEKDLSGFSGNSRITLKWKNLSAESVKYKIEYGIDKDFLQEVVLTKDNVNIWYIGDLINGLEYYFKVQGVDEDGNPVSKESNILSLIPQGVEQVRYGGFVDKKAYKIDNIDKVVENKKGKNVSTGPEIYFLLALALLIGDFIHRKIFSRREKI